MIETQTLKPIKDTSRKLPAGWRWVRLGEVASIHPGQHIMEFDYNYDHIGVGYLTGPADFGESTALVTKWTKNPKIFAEPGDVLITVKGAGVGKANLAPNERVAIGRQLMAVRADSSLLRGDFIYLLMKTQLAVLSNKALGATVPGLGRDDLESLILPLPPLQEQRRIAGVLQEQMAAVDKARSAAQERLEAVKALPAAFLKQVFTGSNARSWPRMKFEQVAILQRGHDLPEQERNPGCYPVVTSSGIVDKHSDYRAKGPGVVTGRSGSIGRVYYIQENFWPHNTALYVKDFKGNNPIYVFYLLQWVNVKAVSSGTGVPTLDRKEVHKLMVAHPSIIEQERIAGVLGDQMAVSEKARAAAEAELVAIDALPAALLRRAFNGEL